MTTLATWMTATSIRAIQLGIDLYGVVHVSLVLALFFIGVLFAHLALHLAGGES